ncbi:hypothetical protein LINGRAHAP2_LOCUS282 [Linum grandiflorum]
MRVGLLLAPMGHSGPLREKQQLGESSVMTNVPLLKPVQ